MGPEGAAGAQVGGWGSLCASAPDVVVELFGGGWPEAAKASAVRALPAPVVVNLEHLSAESYVERSHGLPSPLALPGGALLTTWFYYPGFTPSTGGLLREPRLLARRAAFQPAAWLASQGIEPRAGERVASLFCYRNDALDELLEVLEREPTLLLLTRGPAADQVSERLGNALARGGLRAVCLPMLSQVDFDHLLWSSDLNFVRGEDSLVRAVWAGAPFVWQLSPQDDGAHRVKLEAFLDLFLSDADAELAGSLRPLFARWNGVGEASGPLELPQGALVGAWASQCAAWRDSLASQADLTTGLMEFVASKR
jgi:uncharacterized repeat protein (TIGR03837 family)